MLHLQGHLDFKGTEYFLKSFKIMLLCLGNSRFITTNLSWSIYFLYLVSYGVENHSRWEILLGGMCLPILCCNVKVLETTERSLSGFRKQLTVFGVIIIHPSSNHY